MSKLFFSFLTVGFVALGIAANASDDYSSDGLSSRSSGSIISNDAAGNVWVADVTGARQLEFIDSLASPFRTVFRYADPFGDDKWIQIAFTAASSFSILEEMTCADLYLIAGEDVTVTTNKAMLHLLRSGDSARVWPRRALNVTASEGSVVFVRLSNS